MARAAPQRASGNGLLALRELLPMLRSRRRVLGAVGAAVLVGAALELVPPIVVRDMVDGPLARGTSEGLLGLALVYFGAIAAAQGLSFLTTYLTAQVAQDVLHALRIRLVVHLHRLPLTYFDRTPLGEIISRGTADVDTINTLFTTGVATLVADLVRLATVGVAMLVLSPPLTVVALALVLPVVGMTRFFQVRVRDAERANRRAVGALNTHLQETLRGVETIRATARELQFVARFRAALHDALAAFNRATAYSALYTPLMAILAALATAVLLWVGAANVFDGIGVSLGTLTAFLLLFQRFFQPIITLGDEWQTVQAAVSGAERIFEVLAQPVEEAPAGPAGMVSDDGTAIAVQEVTFGYVPGQPVVREVSIVVRAGETVALIGRTGAGKTSLLHLAAGLYAPWSGSVRIGGIDPRALSEQGRRSHLGVVPQTVQLFSGTVRDNLTLGDRTVELGAVERVAELTGADRFIRSLPEGYETMLNVGSGGRGIQLSGGQRQLLALTRALVWNPAVLLLDEATAAIDAASEAALRAAMREAAWGPERAVLVVAHRLATAREADRVVVLEEGAIVEEGTPAELIARGGRFAALLELEQAGWDWQAAAAQVRC